MNNRFPVLTFISGLMRVIGWIAVIGGVCFAIYAGYTQAPVPGHLLGNQVKVEIVTGIVSAIIGFVIVAFGEIVEVLFAIEENTRISKAVSARASTKEPK